MATTHLQNTLDMIRGYTLVFNKHNYVLTGDGLRVWSNRHTGPTGDHIDHRATGWEHYDANDNLIAEGKTFDELGAYLSKR